MDSSSADRFIPVTVIDVSDGRPPEVWYPHWTFLPTDGEGTHWIHGNYDVNSPEAKALLVAYALAEPDYGFIVFDQHTTTAALRGKRFPLDKSGLLCGGFSGMHPSDTYYITEPSRAH